MDNPCKGCTKRYPACSDHCTEPEYLAWKARQARIKEARKKYQAPAWAKGEARKGHNHGI